jgi:hypothetical protein
MNGSFFGGFKQRGPGLRIEPGHISKPTFPKLLRAIFGAIEARYHQIRLEI